MKAIALPGDFGHYFLVVLLLAGLLITLSFDVRAAEGEEKKGEPREIVIKVKPRILELPGGPAARMPLRAARIRSTNLRELINGYEGKQIEKLYSLRKKESSVGGGLSSGESTSAAVDISSLLTRSMISKMDIEPDRIREVEGTFLLLLNNVEDLNKMLSEFKKLDTVLFVDAIERVR
jgi:hypothetical protein